jgi:hypothetical protein
VRLVVLVVPPTRPDGGLPFSIEGPQPVKTARFRMAEILEDEPVDFAAWIAEAAAAEGRLLMVVDTPLPGGPAARENILVTTDPPGTEPPGLLDGVDPQMTAGVVSRQQILAGMAERFSPDVLLQVLPGDSISVDTLEAVCSFWLGETAAGGCVLAVISPPAGWNRGWAILAGEGVLETQPVGVTPGGLLDTIMILAGLDRVLGDARSVPSVQVLGAGGSLP